MQALEDEEFRAFVQARGHALLRTAYLLTGDRQKAEDLVQSVLEKVVLHWRRVRAAAAMEAYIRQMLYREHLQACRRAKVGEVLLGVVPEPRRARPAADDDQVAVRVDLRRALMQLGVRQRTVLVLRYFEDMPEAEVARVMGTSVGTVKSQATKGLEHLRRCSPDLAHVPDTRTEGHA
jgi:RNA polymerase sigma-70 factor (sigma-E family)